MEETILKEILHEMKGFREDNKALKSEIELLRSDTNRRFEEVKTELKELNENQKGLKTSVEVLQFAINDTRYELIKIKEHLASRVIWNNDSINIVAEDGNNIYGIIKKAEKKAE